MVFLFVKRFWGVFAKFFSVGAGKREMWLACSVRIARNCDRKRLESVYRGFLSKGSRTMLTCLIRENRRLAGHC